MANWHTRCWDAPIACLAACSAMMFLSAGGFAAEAEGMQGAISILSQEAVGHVPVRAVTLQVPWAANPVVVDGDLADWRKSGAAPLVLAGKDHASWFQGSYGGREDLAASVWLCRDDRHLYLAIEISDDRPPAPERVEIAFASADSPLITQWRDVGMRYGADDVHLVFVLGKDDSVRMVWAHIQQRMDAAVVANSFGTEAERREFIEHRSDAAANSKVFSKCSRRLDGARSVTVFEAAVPWKILAPYVPVSYVPMKFNLAIHDRDEDDRGLSVGAIGWTPGLVGTYSAAHFGTLAFDPPAGLRTVQTFAQIPASHFINQDIAVTFSFHNPTTAAQTGSLDLLATPPASGAAILSEKVTVPPGFSQKTLKIHSEKVGLSQCRFRGRLALTGGPTLEIPVHAPAMDDTVFIQALAEIEAKIAELESHASVLSSLYQRIEEKGLDTAYPLAYETLQEMFVPRCRLDLKAGDSARVLRNCAYLEKLFQSSKAYMEKVLENPEAQLRVPPRIAPDQLKIKDGYYSAGDKPVFLWGPCTFWYLRKDQPVVRGLGFNSVCPELPLDPANQEAVAHMEAWYRMGMLVNAGLGTPVELMSFGKSNFLKEHPEIANLDQNNFLPFQVQHPVARQKIAEHYRKSIAFYRGFPGVRSYWLWNEPWYLNYSETTRRDFIEKYLKPRYRTVAALNARWRTRYASFDEVKLIQWPDPANYAPWYDFQQFRDNLLADFFGFLSRTAKDVDPSRPVHTKFMAASLHAFNIERFQALCDIAGFDGSISDRDIVFLDYCKSVLPDHPLVNTEVHIHYGGKDAVELVAWRLALHGLADGNWWCWHSNARFSDSVGNAESMHALAISGLDLQRLFDPYVHALNRKPKSVATLFPDVVERRSDIRMARVRHELAAAQYALGQQPFYATESMVAKGALTGRKLLLAGESEHAKDSTYRGVVDYVKAGGKAIVLRGGFAHNEYGDPRDTGELIQPAAGAPFCAGARIYPLGKGQVILIDAIDLLPDVVLDGGQALAGSPSSENRLRRSVYQRVLAKAMADQGLEDPVRLVAAEGSDPDALYGLDWRCAEVEGGYAFAVLPYAKKMPADVKLATQRPIRKIVDLIRNREAAPSSFRLEAGPNLFRVELSR